MAQYFPPRPHLTPWIYAYSNPAPAYKGLLKVGYTTRSVEDRIKEQFNVEQPEGLKPYRIAERWLGFYGQGCSSYP